MPILSSGQGDPAPTSQPIPSAVEGRTFFVPSTAVGTVERALFLLFLFSLFFRKSPDGFWWEMEGAMVVCVLLV